MFQDKTIPGEKSLALFDGLGIVSSGGPGLSSLHVARVSSQRSRAEWRCGFGPCGSVNRPTKGLWRFHGPMLRRPLAAELSCIDPARAREHID